MTSWHRFSSRSSIVRLLHAVLSHVYSANPGPSKTIDCNNQPMQSYRHSSEIGKDEIATRYKRLAPCSEIELKFDPEDCRHNQSYASSEA